MWHDLCAAFAFLTVLPVGYPTERKPGYSFACFPLVGAAIGLALAGVALLPLPPDLRAFVVLLTWITLTGGLHLDGFGDSCDGLLVTAPPEKRLEIMKDPRAGTWAVVGLIMLLLGKWLLLKTLLERAGHPATLLIFVPVVGRLALVLAAAAFPYARSSGLGNYFREGLGRTQVLIAIALTLIIGAVLVTGLSLQLPLALGILITPFIVVGLIGRWAAGRLGGGLTGDVYGALCELTEVAGLAVLLL